MATESGAADGAWRLERGATVIAGGGVRFEVWAPRVRGLDVRLVGGAADTRAPLNEIADGVFTTTLADAAAGADYVYHVDGRDRPDPVSRHQPHGVHGPSRIVDPRAFRWTDDDWRGREMADLVIYELHVGAFTATGTFDAVIEHLAALRALGVTAIELMPVAEFPGARNWGYDGVYPYAPQSTYGGPAGLKRFIDAAHRADLAVLLDVVYNHLGPEGNYVPEFGPYFTDFYRTPWGAALNFDRAESDEVRRYVVDNARYWVTEYHLDGLRLDAVHAICDASARHVLEEIAAAVHAQAAALGRRVVAIAESDLNDPRLVRPRERGGFALDGQWSDDLHHAIHAALTGERTGYYVDFGSVDHVAKALSDRFVYDGGRSRYRRRRHGAPATDVPADRFVVSIQNHDQVGNRARGDRLATLVSFERQKLAAALLLLSPYVPLLFMGEEYGETNPFLYFVSHSDPALITAVRDGRRREFAAFGWREEISDPAAETTFFRSRLAHARALEPEHRELLALYRELLGLRRRERALRPGAARVRVARDAEAGWIALRLDADGGAALLAMFNLAEEPTTVRLDDACAGGEGWEWTLRLDTDASAYGGRGIPVSIRWPAAAAAVSIPPTTALLYRATGD